jgi:hypothetical protein
LFPKPFSTGSAIDNSVRKCIDRLDQNYQQVCALVARKTNAHSNMLKIWRTWSCKSSTILAGFFLDPNSSWNWSKNQEKINKRSVNSLDTIIESKPRRVKSAPINILRICTKCGNDGPSVVICEKNECLHRYHWGYVLMNCYLPTVESLGWHNFLHRDLNLLRPRAL